MELQVSRGGSARGAAVSFNLFVLFFFFWSSRVACAQSAAPAEKFHGFTWGHYLREFIELEKSYRGPVAESLTWTNKSSSPNHVLVGCLMNGDEYGCLAPLLELFEAFKDGSLNFYSGRLTIFIGNPAAAVSRRRMLQTDLNTAFGSQEFAPTDESKRADELKALFAIPPSLFIDLYQTSQPTDRSFYFFAYNELTYAWAKYLRGANSLVTFSRDQDASEFESTLAGFAQRKGVPALTLEVGPIGYSEEQAAVVKSVVGRAMQGLSLAREPREIFDLARRLPELHIFTSSFRSEFDPQVQLRPGLQNFTLVKKGEVIGMKGDQKVVVPFDGWTLYPKYPPRDAAGLALRPWPTSLYHLLVETAVEQL